PNRFPPGTSGLWGREVNVTNSPGADDSLRITRRTLLRKSVGAGAAIAVSGALGPFASAAESALLRSSAKPRRGGRLRVAIPGGGAQEQMHPFKGTTPADVNRRLQIFDPLFRARSTQGDYKPYLAESVEPNRTGKVWKIILRDVADHRGRPLTADDAIWSLR